LCVIAAKYYGINERKKRPGRKRKAQVYESIYDENKKTETPWFSEDNETGKVRF
jgi:hypothetical protein